jgi:hypothetical protein
MKNNVPNPFEIFNIRTLIFICYLLFEHCCLKYFDKKNINSKH